MGVVYTTEDTELGRFVAVKFPSNDLARRILNDSARSGNYQKREGATLHVPFVEALAVSDECDAPSHAQWRKRR